MIEKRAGWRKALSETVKASIEQPFQYGKRDCCIAAADIVRAISGFDLMPEYRGRYRSAAGAARMIKESGKKDLVSLLRAKMKKAGNKEITPLEAGPGDLVLTDTALSDYSTGQACGVCVGNTAVFPGEIGWVSLPRKCWIAAFKIE